MRVGAKPKPTQLKKLAGNPGKRPLNDNEPRFAYASVTCPAWLDKVARREFKRIVRIAPERLITAADRGTLAAMCQLYSRAVYAEQKIREDAAVITTINLNEVQSPWVGIANTAWERYIRLSAEFGLTPSSRSRISLPTEGSKKSLKEQLQEDDLEMIGIGQDAKFN